MIKLNSPFAGSFPVRLHLRSDLHLARKVWHMTMGLLIAFIYLSGLSRSSAVLILGSLLGLDIFLEAARLTSPAVNEKIMRFFGPVMRSHEMKGLSTVPHYLAATTLAIAIFPKPVAVLSILYLACGDPIASLFGILYGKHSIRFASGKSLIGTLAGVITCTLVTLIFINATALPVSDSQLFALTLIGGIAGGTAELLPFEVDDNFTIPVISGFVLWLGFILCGI
jgi:dolichol kinase